MEFQPVRRGGLSDSVPTMMRGITRSARSTLPEPASHHVTKSFTTRSIANEILSLLPPMSWDVKSPEEIVRGRHLRAHLSSPRQFFRAACLVDNYSLETFVEASCNFRGPTGVLGVLADLDSDSVNNNCTRRVDRLETVVVHERDLRIPIGNLVRTGVEEGDEVIVDVLLTVCCEGAVLGPREHDRDLLRRGIHDACAGREHVEEADEELARVVQVAIRVQRLADLVQLRVGDRDPGPLDSSVGAPVLGACWEWLHLDRVGKDLAVGVHKRCALRYHLQVSVHEHVRAVLGVALAVGGHQVEPVSEIPEDLGHEVVLTHVLEAAHRLLEARREIISGVFRVVGAAWEVRRLEGAVVGLGRLASLGHVEGRQAVDLDLGSEFKLNVDLPAVSRLVEPHCRHFEG
eukprot:573662-Rhodomonas_salina.2